MLPKTIEIAGERLTIREAVAEDVELIFPTWVAEAKQRTSCSRRVFNQFYPNVVRGLIETEPAVVLTKEGGFTIHAWACGRPPNLLHFAYVPWPLRHHGLGRAVISSVLEGYPSTIYVTSSPVDLNSYLKWKRVKKEDVSLTIDRMRLVYNPFVMRTG